MEWRSSAGLGDPNRRSCSAQPIGILQSSNARRVSPLGYDSSAAVLMIALKIDYSHIL